MSDITAKLCETLSKIKVKNPKVLSQQALDDLDRLHIGNSFRDLIKSGKIKLDLGGHLAGLTKRDLQAFLDRHLSWGIFTDLPKNDLAALLPFSKDQTLKPLDQWIKIQDNLFDCHICGEDIVLECNGREFRCANPCVFPKGMPAYEISLNVPSGKIVVANDLRRWFSIVGDYNINKLSGIRQTTEKYATVGMAHCFVGNTCPGVYRVNDNYLVIGVTGVDGKNPVKYSRLVASICTDLWWYSIVDYDEFVRRVGHEPQQGHYEDVVKVKPGIWTFQHQYHKVKDSNRPTVYTHVRWSGEAGPIIDYKAEYNALNYTAEQIIAEDMKRQAWMNGEDYHRRARTKNADRSLVFFMRLADHLMCVAGNGADYHPNGWITDNPTLTPDVKGVEIPVFNRKHHWYPWSKWSTIPRAAGIGEDIFTHSKEVLYLNPSFVRLAFNICRCIVKYGVDSRGRSLDEKTAKQQEQSMIRLAKRSLKGLGKLYPDLIPKNCREFF